MSDPIALLSDKIITQLDLKHFIQQLGGSTDNTGSFVGTIQEKDAAIWIGLSPEELDSVTEKISKTDLRKLQYTPKSLVIIELSTSNFSREIALRFLMRFVEKWSSICSDGHGGYLSHHELLTKSDSQPDLSLR